MLRDFPRDIMTWLFSLLLARRSLDVNKINLLLPHHRAINLRLFHIPLSSSYFSFYNIIVMFEIIYSVLSFLHKNVQQQKATAPCSIQRRIVHAGAEAGELYGRLRRFSTSL